MKFKDIVKKNLDKKDKRFYTPVDTGLLKIKYKKHDDISDREKRVLIKNGVVYYDKDDNKLKMTKKGKERVKNLKEEELMERFNPDDPAPKSKVQGGYKSFVSYLEKKGIDATPKQVKKWFDKREKELEDLEAGLKKNKKIRDPQAAYWAAVRKRMVNSFKS